MLFFLPPLHPTHTDTSTPHPLLCRSFHLQGLHSNDAASWAIRLGPRHGNNVHFEPFLFKYEQSPLASCKQNILQCWCSWVMCCTSAEKLSGSKSTICRLERIFFNREPRRPQLSKENWGSVSARTVAKCLSRRTWHSFWICTHTTLGVACLSRYIQ